MRYASIDPNLFITNRKNFIQDLSPNSIAIFNSNELMPRNADATFPFKQNSDFFYLTGIDQEDSALILFPDCPVEKYREALFVRRTNETIMIWEGEKLSLEEAA